MFSKKFLILLGIFLVAAMGCGLFYGRRVVNQKPIKIYKPVEVAREDSAPKPPPPGETAESGHWHGDEWHSTPHETHEVPNGAFPPQSPIQTETLGGYWSNGVYHRPAGYVPAYPRGQTSSNPFFADGVPEHLKCPEKWIGAYRWAISDWAAAVEKINQVANEVMANYNPNRPIHEVWPRFIEDELFYQANADIPPLDPERYPPGSFAELAAAPERIEAVDRIDWFFQHALDYPEVMELMDTGGYTYNNAWRMELGFDPPDWNVVTLLDGRKFRSRSDHRYEFTFTDGNQTFTSTYQHSGSPNSPLVKINLNETSDEELEALGIDYSIIPYRQGGK